jgi:hypothetical protein
MEQLGHCRRHGHRDRDIRKAPKKRISETAPTSLPGSPAITVLEESLWTARRSWWVRELLACSDVRPARHPQGGRGDTRAVFPRSLHFPAVKGAASRLASLGPGGPAPDCRSAPAGWRRRSADADSSQPRPKESPCIRVFGMARFRQPRVERERRCRGDPPGPP